MLGLTEAPPGPPSELPTPSSAAMAASPHLQDSQVGGFVFLGLLLGHFIFLLPWAIFYIHHDLIWFCVCGYLVEIVRLLTAAEMRRKQSRAPSFPCSGMCHDTSFQKERVTFCCRTAIVCALQNWRRCHSHSNAMSADSLGPVCWPILVHARTP